jgi:hypothetical protein
MSELMDYLHMANENCVPKLPVISEVRFGVIIGMSPVDW